MQTQKIEKRASFKNIPCISVALVVIDVFIHVQVSSSLRLIQDGQVILKLNHTVLN